MHQWLEVDASDSRRDADTERVFAVVVFVSVVMAVVVVVVLMVMEVVLDLELLTAPADHIATAARSTDHFSHPR